MMREGGGAGVFNPFTQSKLEDIVPARMSIKVTQHILHMYITPEAAHFSLKKGRWVVSGVVVLFVICIV